MSLKIVASYKEYYLQKKKSASIIQNFDFEHTDKKCMYHNKKNYKPVDCQLSDMKILSYRNGQHSIFRYFC